MKKQNFVFGFNSTAFGSRAVDTAGIFVVREMTKPSKSGKVKKDGSDLGDSSCYLYFFSVESIDKIIKEMRELRKKMNKNKSIMKNNLIIVTDDKRVAKNKKKK